MLIPLSLQRKAAGPLQSIGSDGFRKYSDERYSYKKQ